MMRHVLMIMLVAFLAACSSKPKEPPKASEPRANPMQTQFEHGVKLMHEGKLQEAKAIMEAIHKVDPRLTGPMLNLALINIKLDDKGAAMDWLDRVLKLLPTHPVALTYSGLMAREEGMFALAEQRYRQALEATPDYAPAVLNLAILLDMYRGRLREALELYETYQALQPKPDPKVKDWIFDIKQRLGDKQ